MSISNTVLFVVQVSLAGGADQSNLGPPTYPEPGVPIPSQGSTAATYTYNVSDLNGNSLGTGMTPKKPRPSGPLIAGGGLGTGYYDESTTFQLYDAGETKRPQMGDGNT
jgi:hypothetical protein